jgi:hypothetical protein
MSVITQFTSADLLPAMEALAEPEVFLNATFSAGPRILMAGSPRSIPAEPADGSPRSSSAVRPVEPSRGNHTRRHTSKCRSFDRHAKLR